MVFRLYPAPASTGLNFYSCIQLGPRKLGKRNHMNFATVHWVTTAPGLEVFLSPEKLRFPYRVERVISLVRKIVQIAAKLPQSKATHE